jgi:hypothetical protein
MQRNGIRLQQAGKKIGRDRHPARRDDDRPDDDAASLAGAFLSRSHVERAVVYLTVDKKEIFLKMSVRLIRSRCGEKSRH